MMDLTYTIKPTVPALFSGTPMTMAETKSKVDALEEASLKLPQIPMSGMKLKEYYSGGMYGREITIPAGTCLTGMVYKRDHLEIMVSGEIYVLSADGQLHHYKGYNVIEATAGKRQAGFCVEDTTWITINLAPEDVEDYLAYTSVRSFDEYYKFIQEVNLEDFQRLLTELQMTEEEMYAQSSVNDLVDLPKEYSYIYVKESHLAGQGLFSEIDIMKGDVICPARLGDNRTIAGRYTNHALVPNTRLELVNGFMCLVATRAIQAGDELTLNYREVLKFRMDRGDL